VNAQRSAGLEQQGWALPAAAMMRAMTSPVSVDAYLAALPERERAVLEHLRATIRAAAPEAVETIAYDMPAFRVNGRFLVSFAAYKRHCSLFPASQAVRDALGDEVAPYVKGRGTIQFPADAPPSDDLITRIVRIRLEERGPNSPLMVSHGRGGSEARTGHR
jgi:uncharacterized protein YdhG (YjbR/CyaY superfamily)